MAAASPADSTPARLRPKSYTVFAAAFLAGAAAAVGVNRVLDVHLAQRKPLVECEPIFVALRPLPQGSPVTVWDVALKDWPKAMLPGSALRAGDSFEGFVLRHAIREGQPLLAVQLIRTGSQIGSAAAVETFVPAVPVATTAARPAPPAEADLWTPSAATTPAPAPASTADTTAVAAVPKPEEPRPQADKEVAAPVAEPAEPPATEVAADAATEQSPAAGPPALFPEPQAVEQDSPTVADAPVAPSPTASVSGVPTPQPTPADTATAAPEMDEAVATDAASMPSVMKQPAIAGAAAATPPPTDAGRYLVVPERIALQADTSFTTPRPQPPGPPSASKPVANAKPRTSSRTPGPNDPRRGTPTTSQPRQQSAPASRSRQLQPTPRESQTSAARRSWTPFPAIAAGIEALGSPWQRANAPATRPPADAVRR